jgi:hypothetical protein
MLEAHPSGILGLQFCSKTMCLGSDEGKKNTVPALELTNRPGWPNHLIWGVNYSAIYYIYEVPEMSKYARIGYEIWWDMELKDMNDGMMVGMKCGMVWCMIYDACRMLMMHDVQYVRSTLRFCLVGYNQTYAFWHYCRHVIHDSWHIHTHIYIYIKYMYTHAWCDHVTIRCYDHYDHIHLYFVPKETAFFRRVLSAGEDGSVRCWALDCDAKNIVLQA